MANRVVNEIQADFLTCKICKLPFKQPKALSCLHTFCKGCLLYHVQQNGAKGKDGSLCVFCPLCTQVCELPRSGVDGLKDNQLLKNLLDMVNSKSYQNCDICREDGETNAATYCCVKCEDFLCDECAKMHKRTRITRDHLIVNVGSMMDICRGLQGQAASSKINARLLSKFGRHGHALHNPISIAVNKADDVLISNENNTVSMFSISGNCKKVLEQEKFYGSEKHFLPNKCLTITSEGYVAVAMRKDTTPQLVHMAVVQSLAEREISILTAKLKHPQDCQPHGITVTQDNHTIISDVGRNCIYIFDPELQMIRQFGKKGSKGRRQFKGPHYVTTTPTGEIVVSDYGNHCVKVFDMKGRPKLVIGRMGKAQGEFNHPMGVCCDKFGNIFVADRDNHRVQMFDKSGRFLAFIIASTCKDGHDIRPQDLAISVYGHLVVLLRGIEGAEMAEIQVYQYGSSKQTPASRPTSPEPVVSPKDVSVGPPRRLPPLKGATAETPDLLHGAAKDATRQQEDRDAVALAAMYTTATGRHVDPHSSVCTIL